MTLLSGASIRSRSRRGLRRHDRGRVLFDRAKDAQMRTDMAKERQTLEQLDVNKAPGAGGAPPRIPTESARPNTTMPITAMEATDENVGINRRGAETRR